MAFCGRSGFRTHGIRVSPVQLLILAALMKKPAHGYNILRLLQKRMGGDWKVKSGTLYPALRSLEEKGLIEGTDVPQEGKPDAIQYKLTPQGQKILHGALSSLGDEFQVFDNFWRFLGTSVGDKSATVLFDETLRTRTPMGFIMMKRHCQSESCDARHLEFLKHYREYLMQELEWVKTQLTGMQQNGEGGEKK